MSFWKLVFSACLISLIAGCDGGGNSSNTNSESLSYVSGIAQKGDFIEGSLVTIEGYSEEGLIIETYKTAILSNSRFEFPSNLNGDKFLITIEGYFINELTGNQSNEPIELKGWSPKGAISTNNVNLFSDLWVARSFHYINSGMSLTSAFNESLSDLKQVLYIDESEAFFPNELDIKEGKESHAAFNANLLLFSGSFVDSNIGSEGWDTIRDDFSEKGRISSTNNDWILLLNSAKTLNINDFTTDNGPDNDAFEGIKPLWISDEPVVFNNNLIDASETLSDALLEINDNSLTLSSSSELGKSVSIDSIISSEATDEMPFGMALKVTDYEVLDNGNIKLHTEEAGLHDIVTSGSITFSSWSDENTSEEVLVQQSSVKKNTLFCGPSDEHDYGGILPESLQGIYSPSNNSINLNFDDNKLTTNITALNSADLNFQLKTDEEFTFDADEKTLAVYAKLHLKAGGHISVDGSIGFEKNLAKLITNCDSGWLLTNKTIKVKGIPITLSYRFDIPLSISGEGTVNAYFDINQTRELRKVYGSDTEFEEKEYDNTANFTINSSGSSEASLSMIAGLGIQVGQRFEIGRYSEDISAGGVGVGAAFNYFSKSNPNATPSEYRYFSFAAMTDVFLSNFITGILSKNFGIDYNDEYTTFPMYSKLTYASAPELNTLFVDANTIEADFDSPTWPLPPEDFRSNESNYTGGVYGLIYENEKDSVWPSYGDALTANLMEDNKIESILGIAKTINSNDNNLSLEELTHDIELNYQFEIGKEYFFCLTYHLTSDEFLNSSNFWTHCSNPTRFIFGNEISITTPSKYISKNDSDFEAIQVTGSPLNEKSYSVRWMVKPDIYSNYELIDAQFFSLLNGKHEISEIPSKVLNHDNYRNSQMDIRIEIWESEANNYSAYTDITIDEEKIDFRDILIDQKSYETGSGGVSSVNKINIKSNSSLFETSELILNRIMNGEEEASIKIVGEFLNSTLYEKKATIKYKDSTINEHEKIVYIDESLENINLSPGKYRVEIEGDNLSKTLIRNIILTDESSVYIDDHLKVNSGLDLELLINSQNEVTIKSIEVDPYCDNLPLNAEFSSGVSTIRINNISEDLYSYREIRKVPDPDSPFYEDLKEVEGYYYTFGTIDANITSYCEYFLKDDPDYEPRQLINTNDFLIRVKGKQTELH